MAKDVNTTQSIKEAKTDGDLTAEMVALNKELQEEEKVEVLIPKVYQNASDKITYQSVLMVCSLIFLLEKVPIPKSYKQLVDEF